jgi:Domain of unknown function (DUF4193)
VATDYDTPRTDVDEASEQSLEALKARRAEAAADLGDDVDPFETELDLPSADLSAEGELTVRVLPRQADEFTCMSCYLVHHRSQLADERKMVCTDCAA